MRHFARNASVRCAGDGGVCRAREVDEVVTLRGPAGDLLGGVVLTELRRVVGKGLLEAAIDDIDRAGEGGGRERGGEGGARKCAYVDRPRRVCSGLT